MHGVSGYGKCYQLRIINYGYTGIENYIEWFLLVDSWMHVVSGYGKLH